MPLPKTSLSRLTRQSKMKRQGMALAYRMYQNSPEVKRYQMYNKRMKDLRSKLRQRYAQRGMMEYRRQAMRRR